MLYKAIPKLYVVKKPTFHTRQAEKVELTNKGECKRCGRHYKWTVQELEQHTKPDTEEEDNKTRAMRLFKEYNPSSEGELAGLGHCCAEREHRIFISQNVGGVIYE